MRDYGEFKRICENVCENRETRVGEIVMRPENGEEERGNPPLSLTIS